MMRVLFYKKVLILLLVTCFSGCFANNSTLDKSTTAHSTVKERQQAVIKQVKEYRNKTPTYKFIEQKNCQWPVRSDLISLYSPEMKFYSRHWHKNSNYMYRVSIVPLGSPENPSENYEDTLKSYKAGEPNIDIHSIEKYKGFDIIAYKLLGEDPLDYNYGHKYLILRKDIAVLMNSYIDEEEVKFMIDHCVKTNTSNRGNFKKQVQH